MNDSSFSALPHVSTGQAPIQLIVARAALTLFSEHGFNATSVEQIAAAAGISRSTFFRHFGSKEEAMFADHSVLLERVSAFLQEALADPWLAVCQASELVFSHFADEDALAAQRYAVINAHPALRDKELITVFRYEKLFDAHLRAALPSLDPLDSVRFAAAVIATHNYLLREYMRDVASVTNDQVRKALDDVRRLFGVLDEQPRMARDDPLSHAPSKAGTLGEPDDVVVAVFSRSTPPEEITLAVRRMLNPSEIEPESHLT